MTRLSVFLVSLAVFNGFLAAQPQLNLVPWPVEVKVSPGSYQLKNKLSVYSAFPERINKILVGYLKAELKNQFNIEATQVTTESNAGIILFPKRMPTSGAPAYELVVSASGIRLNANFEEIAFNGIQTLLQLIPAKDLQVPHLSIFDQPRFKHRGMHLDVSRHFFPVSFVKRYIDYLAYHKMNSFHWHLTDDQGWRIEIKKFPKLTQVGGYRNGTIIGRYPGKGSDNTPYGGFYTQAEIKEVVAYAAEKFINVIPEIEMPGHASAAIAAYPQLSCFPDTPTAIPVSMISPKSLAEQSKGRIKLVQETWGVFDDVFCAGKENTFNFLEAVMDEVLTLFPSKYIHVGGDECPKTHWKICPNCQKRIRDNNLKDEHELQSYFIQRMEKYLNNKGRILIGWDEILEGGLAPNAVVMSWRGEKGGIAAAKLKHDVIMSPENPVYFDHTQSNNEDSVTIGGYNPIEKVYAYEPAPAALTAEEAIHVLGAQANLWTEYIKYPSKVEYMVFPRMAALSEVLWSPKESRNWNHFTNRLPAQIKRYESWNANYSKAYFDLKASVIPSAGDGVVTWKLASKDTTHRIVYQKTQTMDDPPNPPPFVGYTNPIPVYNNSEYSGWTIIDGRSSNRITQKFHINKATGKKITLKGNASEKYPGDGAFTLVNGVINEKGRGRDHEFLGFNGTDCEVIIDLGSEQPVSVVIIHALKQTGSWIWQPRKAELFGSSNGSDFYPIQSTENFNETNNGKGTMLLGFKATPLRYVQIKISNWNKIPDGNAGAGHPAWIFIDEIEIHGPEE